MVSSSSAQRDADASNGMESRLRDTVEKEEKDTRKDAKNFSHEQKSCLSWVQNIWFYRESRWKHADDFATLINCKWN